MTTTTSPGQLYISYAPESAAYVTKLSAWLRKSGINVALGPDPSRGLEMDAMRRRMDRSTALLIVTTSASSDQIMEELNLGQSAEIPILVLVREGRRPMYLNQYPYESVTREQLPSTEFLDELRRAVGASPVDIGPSGGRRRRLALIAGAALLVLAVLGGATWLATRFSGSPSATPSPRVPTAQPPAPTSSPATTTTDPTAIASGKVAISSPHDGDAVDRCVPITGVANLDPGKTMLFAKMRTNPSDQTWYFDYVGGYRNGFVPTNWHGATYLGSETGQRYDIFIIVLNVADADAFWNAHKSKDGTYAFAQSLPPTAQRAAVVRVQQGTTDDCQ